MLTMDVRGLGSAMAFCLAIAPPALVEGFGGVSNGPFSSSTARVTINSFDGRNTQESMRPFSSKIRDASTLSQKQRIRMLPPDGDMDMASGMVHNILTTTSNLISDASAGADSNGAATQEFGTRNLSYYSTLALYALSFPGLWSTIKRSTAAKMKQKTYVSAGEAAPDGKALKQQAGEIMAYMKAKNYEVAEAGEVITFRGVVARSTSQAFFLTFCTALGLASLALVLQIQFNDLELPVIGVPNWFYLVLLSPYAGIYYWKSGDRVDEVKVKLEASDDDMINEITIQADDEELDRMWRTLDLREKGMVKVEGIL